MIKDGNVDQKFCIEYVFQAHDIEFVLLILRIFLAKLGEKQPMNIFEKIRNRSLKGRIQILESHETSPIGWQNHLRRN